MMNTFNVYKTATSNTHDAICSATAGISQLNYNTNISLLNQMWVEYKATGGGKYPASFTRDKARYWFRTAHFLYRTYNLLR